MEDIKLETNVLEGFENNYNVDPEENAEDLANPTSRKLYIDKSDRSLSDLFRMISENQLDLQPDFQRNYVWTNKKASKFIESLLLGIPIPTIFLAEDKSEDAIYEVVDGQQRLTSIKKFFDDKLKLTGLVTLSDFNNKKFTDLDEKYQRLLKNSRTLSVVIIKNESDPTIKFDIFQRINEGAIKLSSQELRNVIYRGKMIDTISNLSKETSFKQIFNQESMTVKKKIDEEFILRMIAMNEFVLDNTDKLSLSDKYRGSLSTAMNSFLEDYRNDNDKAAEVFNLFEKTIDIIISVFGKDTFCMPLDENYEVSKNKNRTLAEFMYIVFSRIKVNNLSKEKVKQKFYDVVYKNSNIFRAATGNTENVRRRINLASELLGDLNVRQ